MIIYSIFFQNNDLLIVFLWNFRFLPDSHADWLLIVLYKYAAFSCVASPKSSFLKISLPQVFGNVPNVK